MFNFLKGKQHLAKRSITIPLIGTFKYIMWPDNSFWLGKINTIIENKEINLSIETYNNGEPTIEQIILIQALPADIDYYLDIMFAYLETAYDKYSLETIKQMYFLEAIELKAKGDKWYFTLEAHSDVPSMYSDFQRFAIEDKLITWSNISLD